MAETMQRAAVSTPCSRNRRRGSLMTSLPEMMLTNDRSFRPRAGGLDDLAPFLDLLRHIGAEAVRRVEDRGDAHGGEPRPGGGIGEAGIDLGVEPRDDLGRCPPRHAEAAPG